MLSQACCFRPWKGSIGAPQWMVVRSSLAGSVFAVNAETANNTAVAPGDYVSSSGTLTFVRGQRTATLTVGVNDDAGVRRLEDRVRGEGRRHIDDAGGRARSGPPPPDWPEGCAAIPGRGPRRR